MKAVALAALAALAAAALGRRCRRAAAAAAAAATLPIATTAAMRASDTRTTKPAPIATMREAGDCWSRRRLAEEAPALEEGERCPRRRRTSRISAGAAGWCTRPRIRRATTAPRTRSSSRR